MKRYFYRVLDFVESLRIAPEKIHYFDDPISERKDWSTEVLGALLMIIVVLLSFEIKSVYAANINLSSGLNQEFGQGIQQTVACSGNTPISISPLASFTNVGGGGSFNISGFTVSNIPATCNNVDFNFNAYDQSNSTPLTLYGAAGSDVIIGSRAGDFGPSLSSYQNYRVIVNSNSSFTVQLVTPVAATSNFFKITVQSTKATITIAGKCYSTSVCNLGDVGPGGGIVYYYASGGFSCGPSFISTGSPSGGLCHYLEMAPSNWSGSTDPSYPWATVNTGTFLGINSAEFGRGYKNSLDIISAGNSTGSAAYIARGYSGNGLSDWYLPSSFENDALIAFATASPNSTSNPGYGISNDRSSPKYGYYWSSTEYGSSINYPGYAAIKSAYWGGGGISKTTSTYLRPIRAF